MSLVTVDATVDVVVILSAKKIAEKIVSDLGSFKQLTDSHSMHGQKRKVKVPLEVVDGLLEVKHLRSDEGSSFMSSSSVHFSDLAL